MAIPSAVWNDTIALANVAGDQEILIELMEIWLRQTPRLLLDIKQAVQSDNPDALHLAAHTLKGSLQVFGMETAASIAAALEVAGRTRNLAGGADLERQLEAELALVVPQIIAYQAAHEFLR